MATTSFTVIDDGIRHDVDRVAFVVLVMVVERQAGLEGGRALVVVLRASGPIERRTGEVVLLYLRRAGLELLLKLERAHGLGEGASTRLLIYAGELISGGISPRRACQVAINWAVTDDASVQRSIEEIISSIFE